MRFLISKSGTQRFVYPVPALCPLCNISPALRGPAPVSTGAVLTTWTPLQMRLFPAPGQAARLLCFPICLLWVLTRQTPSSQAARRFQQQQLPRQLPYLPCSSGVLWGSGGRSCTSLAGTVSVCQRRWMAIGNMVSIDTDTLPQGFWDWVCWVGEEWQIPVVVLVLGLSCRKV